MPSSTSATWHRRWSPRSGTPVSPNGPAPHEVSADAPCEIVEGDLADTPEARVVNGAVQRQGCKPIGRGQTTLRLCCPLERDAATCQDYHETRPHLLRVADDSHVLRWLL